VGLRGNGPAVRRRLSGTARDGPVEIEFACQNGNEAALKAKRERSSTACEDRLPVSAATSPPPQKRPPTEAWRPNLRALDWSTERSQFVQTNLTREGFAAASAAIVVRESPASVSVSPDESVIVVAEVPPVECVSSAARSAAWLIPTFR
jgi:hypothetical protein